METNPNYLNYEPVFQLSENNGIEHLVKIIRDRTIKYLHDCGFYWANEVTIWTYSIFTFQLQIRLRDAFKKAKPLCAEEIAKDIIAHYHLRVVAVYPQLKEY